MGTTGALSHIFALSKNPPAAATVPFADICKPTATKDSETQGQDSGPASSGPLIQELEEEGLAEGESNQPLPPQTCASDPALAHSSEDGESQLPAATPLGNSVRGYAGRMAGHGSRWGFLPIPPSDCGVSPGPMAPGQRLRRGPLTLGLRDKQWRRG